MPSLQEKLLTGVEIATETQGKEFFSEDDSRWGETLTGEDSPTGRPIIFINDEKLRNAGAKNFRKKMVALESIHRLKDVEPERYQRLFDAAVSSPEYMAWAQESYQRALDDKKLPETRDFEPWHRASRFDQVIGGFLMAGDKDIPTAKGWTRDLPFGEPFKQELRLLEQELGFRKPKVSPTQ